MAREWTATIAAQFKHSNQKKQMALPPPSSPLDEVTPIARYIVDEMRRNASCEATRLMYHLNHYPQDACDKKLRNYSTWSRIQETACKGTAMPLTVSNTAAALAIWAYKVGPRQEWDHKPKILKKFPTKKEYEGNHRHFDRLYYHDIWSNIHYGYVGIHAGFDEWTLLNGSGAAQFASDVVTTKNIPLRNRPITNSLVDYDPPRDRESIRLGMKLHGAIGLTAEKLIQAIKKSAIKTRPVPGP